MSGDILDLIDAVGGLSYGGAGGIKRTRCVRRGCQEDCEGDSGFCARCLAWARGDTDVDPRAHEHHEYPPPVAPYPPEPVEEWNDYLRRARNSQ